jgi:hypothetical protein
MRIVLILFFFVFNFASWSQNYIYQNDTSISDSKGIPKKIGTLYFPTNMFIDTIKQGCLRDIRKVKSIPFGTTIPKDSVECYDTIYTKVDKSDLDRFSKFLYSSNEPILCNYYLGEEIYRLTWHRSFHPDIVIRIIKRKNDILMICKKISGFLSDNIYENDNKGNLKKIWKSNPKFERDTILHLDKKVFNDFEKIVRKSNFNKIPNKRYEGLVCDGSEWILEMHKSNSYWVVNRWSPNHSNNPKLRELCDYLIDNSIFKNENRY